jgi:hypothetical protein
LEEYVEDNWGMTPEKAVEQWLDDHGYNKSKLRPLRQTMREQLMGIARTMKRGSAENVVARFLLAGAQSEQRWHDKQDAKQTAFIEKLNPKPGQFAQLSDWYGDVWGEIEQVFDNALTMHTGRGRAEYTFFKDLRRVVATIPEGKARIVHTDDGTYGGRKGRPISEFPKLAARLAQRFLLACGENCSCGGQCSGDCGDAHVAPPSSNPF